MDWWRTCLQNQAGPINNDIINNYSFSANTHRNFRKNLLMRSFSKLVAFGPLLPTWSSQEKIPEEFILISVLSTETIYILMGREVRLAVLDIRLVEETSILTILKTGPWTLPTDSAMKRVCWLRLSMNSAMPWELLTQLNAQLLFMLTKVEGHWTGWWSEG